MTSPNFLVPTQNSCDVRKLSVSYTQIFWQARSKLIYLQQYYARDARDQVKNFGNFLHENFSRRIFLQLFVRESQKIDMNVLLENTISSPVTSPVYVKDFRAGKFPKFLKRFLTAALVSAIVVEKQHCRHERTLIGCSISSSLAVVEETWR